MNMVHTIVGVHGISPCFLDVGADVVVELVEPGVGGAGLVVVQFAL